MLTSMCLRRNRDVISLPGITETICEPTFTKREKVIYDGRVTLLKNAITKETNRGPRDRGSSRKPVLEAVLRLRIFCNIGLVGNLELDQMFSLLQQEDETNCYSCEKGILSLGGDGSGEKPRMTHCYRVVCGTCVPSVERSRNGTDCPACFKKHEGNLFLDFEAATIRNEDDGEEELLRSNHPWPSKLLAVTEDLARHLESEKRYTSSLN